MVLAELPGRVVIFFDEIDSTLKIEFSDDFFAAIRVMYNLRATDPQYERLTFVLLGVATPSIMVAPEMLAPAPLYDATLEARQELLRAELARLADGLSREQLRVTPLVAVGFPAEAIVDMAAERGADLIVMATHGHSGIRRWALGSVADKVLHTTTTPLVLVRAGERI